jgi:hypothetical protein
LCGTPANSQNVNCFALGISAGDFPGDIPPLSPRQFRLDLPSLEIKYWGAQARRARKGDASYLFVEQTMCARSSVRWGVFLFAEPISRGQVSDVAHTEANIIWRWTGSLPDTFNQLTAAAIMSNRNGVASNRALRLF